MAVVATNTELKLETWARARARARALYACSFLVYKQIKTKARQSNVLAGIMEGAKNTSLNNTLLYTPSQLQVRLAGGLPDAR